MDAYAGELAQYTGRRPFVALTAALALDDRGEVLFKAEKYAQAVVAMAPGAVMSPYPDLYEKLPARAPAQRYLQLVQREGGEPTEEVLWAQSLVRATEAPADRPKR